MTQERAINAAKAHVPLAVVLAAIGITATTLIKLDSMVKNSVRDEFNYRLPATVMRLDAMERRVDEIKATQVWVTQELQRLAVEQARLVGAERARRGDAAAFR